MPVPRKASLPDTSGTHVWLVLMKAHHALARRAAESIRALDVGLSDFGVLELLLHKGAQPVNAIGRAIHLTSGAITTAIDRLESQGLVVREPHPNDRRAWMVNLTPRGKRHAEKTFAAHKAEMDSVASELSGADRAQLIRLLKTLGASAEKGPAAKLSEK